MKKLLFISVALFTTLSMNAQVEKLIYEMDWAGVEYNEWNYFVEAPNASYYKATDEGLAITNPAINDHIWEVRVINRSSEDHGLSLEEGHDYVVRLTLKVPSDGKLFMQLGALYSSWYDGASVKASDDWQVIDIKNQCFYSDIPNAHVLLGLGEIVGTTILKKVQVYEVLGSSVQDDMIVDLIMDGLNGCIRYHMLEAQHKAMLMEWSIPEEEVNIPSEVSYEGEVYTVMSINKDAFMNLDSVTKITVPKTIRSMDFDYDGAIYANPFRECKSLEWIEVEDGCPLFSSVDGVLFAEDGTMLLGYPIASSRDTYTVPKGVTNIRSDAFVHNKYLRKLVIPEEVTYLGWNLFDDTKSLEELYIKGVLEPGCMSDLFDGMDTKVTVYVQPSEVDKFKAVYKGPVYPLPEAQGSETEQSDYIPFVELGKQWHVVSNPTNPYVPCSFERYEMYDEVERDGKTYVHIRRIVDGKDTEGYDEVGLFREENRRVYKYEGGRDVMLYDFSLKEGDTFTYEYGILGEPMNCKVLKQGWLEDGPQIEMLDSLTSEGAWTFKYRKLRKWTIGRDNGSGDYREATTWIEGIGTLMNTFIRPYTTGYMSFLAYIYRIDRPGDNDYLPFSLCNMYGPVYGCELPKGVPDNSEDWHEHFSYELDGDRLHVSGNVSLNCGGYYYAYFTEERTDDPMVRKLHFRIEEIGELTTCGNRYGTDFYVSGLNPNINYIIVDDNGEEHPVISKTPQDKYRPFIEEGKVWQVGDTWSGNPVQSVEYYYFDGDTIIDGKTCKQMMCQRYVAPDHPDYAVLSQLPSLRYVGTWYEEDQKVYKYNSSNQFNLMYDFSVDANATLQIHGQSYVIGPKQSGGMKGFKGVYRDVMMLWDEAQNPYNTTWLEGVGGIDGPMVNVYYGEEGHAVFLMACAVGDEVIYYNDEYEDGATPAEARKNRIDFTHIVKEKPKTRPEVKSLTRSEEESLYGEYNEQRLSINLDPINDSYLVSINDESGKVVYEKPINAGNIVGLNIDISTYPEGRYIVTVDNSIESFTGEFKTQTTGMKEVRMKKEDTRMSIYNLQGQRLNSLQKGLNIVNGQKVYVR